MIQWKRHALALSVAGLVAVALVGCAGGGANTPTATTTVTESTSASPSSGSSASTPSSSPSDGQGGDTGGGSASGLCTVSQLKGGVAAGSGGAAGSTIIHLTFTNSGSISCTLQGWPGVSFVGNNNGTQLGAAATFDRSSPHPTVTLAPGAVAVAPLKIVQASNYDNADCGPAKADGFRVYPPGSKQALFVPASGYTACTQTGVDLLNVQGIVSEGSATD